VKGGDLMLDPAPRRQLDPHRLILGLNNYRMHKLRISICQLAADMTAAGFPMKCRTLTHVFTQATDRAAGRASTRRLPRDVTVCTIVDYVRYLRTNAKRRQARAAKRAAAPQLASA
jgi:hypothetical protein